MFRALFAAAVIALAPAAHAADCTTGSKQMKDNKKVVAEFYELAVNQKNFSAAAKFLGPHYIQHNPQAVDGPQGLQAYINFLREKFPNSHSDVKRVFADGDYVIQHVHSVRVPGTRGNAIVNIFRLENGKIVEHWDVIEQVPEKSANTNTMF